MPGNPRSVVLRKPNFITGSKLTIKKPGMSPAEQIQRDVLSVSLKRMRKTNRAMAVKTLKNQKITLNAIRKAAEKGN